MFFWRHDHNRRDREFVDFLIICKVFSGSHKLLDYIWVLCAVTMTTTYWYTAAEVKVNNSYNGWKFPYISIPLYDLRIENQIRVQIVLVQSWETTCNTSKRKTIILFLWPHSWQRPRYEKLRALDFEFCGVILFFH